MKPPTSWRFLFALGILMMLGCGGAEEHKAREATKTARDVKWRAAQERLAAREREAREHEATKDEAAWRKSPAYKVQQKHPDWSRFVCEAVAKRSVFVGMTANQAQAAWGKPRHTRARTTAEGSFEVWCYDSSCTQMLGLANGKVTLIDQ